MKCALCMYEDDGRAPAPAITIANGHAMCIGHFDNSKELLSTSYGGLGLRAIAKALEATL